MGPHPKEAAVLAAMPYRKTLAQPKAEVNQNSGAKQHQDRSTIPVTNTGKRAGKEVVQLYITEKKPTVLRPNKELKAFKKVTVEPGKKAVVTFEVNKQMCAFWCDKSHAWTTNPGEYEILIGTSSADIATTLPFTVK